MKKMHLITERGVNLNFFPVKNNVEGNYIRKKDGKLLFIAQEGSRWTPRCYKLMDFLASKVRDFLVKHYEKNYEGKIPISPKNNWIFNNFPLLENPLDRLKIFQYCLDGDQYYLENDQFHNIFNKYRLGFTIPIKEITKTIPSFTTDRILNTLDIASNCSIKIEFPIHSVKGRTLDGGYNFGYTKWNNFEENNFERLFEYKIIDGEIKNGKMYNRKIGFKFDSILGACFLHNIFTGAWRGIDTIPLYKLTPSSEIVYRRYFLFYSRMGITLNVDTLTNLLGLVSNKPQKKLIFKRIVEELLDYNLVEVVEKFNHVSIKLKTSKRSKIIHFPMKEKK